MSWICLFIMIIVWTELIMMITTQFDWDKGLHWEATEVWWPFFDVESCFCETGSIFIGNVWFDLFWQAVMFGVSQCTAIEIWLELKMGKVAGVNTIILQSKPG